MSPPIATNAPQKAALPADIPLLEHAPVRMTANITTTATERPTNMTGPLLLGRYGPTLQESVTALELTSLTPGAQPIVLHASGSCSTEGLVEPGASDAWLEPAFAFHGSSPRRSQLDSCFVERGTLQANRLRRSPVIVLFPWNAGSDAKLEPKPALKERRDPLKLARYYRSLLASDKFESRAALARYLGVSRARVSHVLRRLN
jgi:hypothetical protein